MLVIRDSFFRRTTQTTSSNVDPNIQWRRSEPLPSNRICNVARSENPKVRRCRRSVENPIYRCHPSPLSIFSVENPICHRYPSSMLSYRHPSPIRSLTKPTGMVFLCCLALTITSSWFANPSSKFTVQICLSPSRFRYVRRRYLFVVGEICLWQH